METNNSNNQQSLIQPSNQLERLQTNQHLQQSALREFRGSRVSQDISNQIQDSSLHKKSSACFNKSQKTSDLRLNNTTAGINALKNQIMSKIVQHNREIVIQQVPSPEQISKCAQMLEQQFPRMKVDHVIKVLQDLLVNNCKAELNTEEQSFNSISEEQGEHSLNRNDYSKANALVRERSAVHVPSGFRLSQQKKIAISYLNHGYGVRVLRHYIKDPAINSTRYNNVITTIMKIAFRRLEEHIKGMGRSVVPVNSQDEKVIRAPLTNCQKWLPPEELETFYKFIKLACCLQQKVEISSASAIKLYDLCIRQLRQRQTNEQNHRNQKIMRGSHRLPRIAQGMYNLIGNFNSHPSSQAMNGLSNYDRMFYPGQTLKMQRGPNFFPMNHVQRKRLDPAFQKFNVQAMKNNYNKI